MWADDTKPLHPFALHASKVTFYVGLIARAVNIAVALVANMLVPADSRVQPAEGSVHASDAKLPH